MASESQIFSLYKVPNKEKYYLLRTERPSYSNASQSQENQAVSIEQNKRTHILKRIGKAHGIENCSDFECIGELQGFPIGNALYDYDEKVDLDIYYMETEFGHPWIVLGNASSETEFLAELDDDEDLLRLKPVGQPKQIKVEFLTEKDVALSGL